MAVPICFLSGWTNENAACGVLAAVFCMLANRYRRKEKVPLAAWFLSGGTGGRRGGDDPCAGQFCARVGLCV